MSKIYHRIKRKIDSKSLTFSLSVDKGLTFNLFYKGQMFTSYLQTKGFLTGNRVTI